MSRRAGPPARYNHFMRSTMRSVRGTLSVAALLAAVLGSWACSTPAPSASQRTAEERAADRDVADRVDDALRADSNLFSRHVIVDTRRGVVWLTGWVMSADEEREAVRVASAVPGVKRVINQIDVLDFESVHW